MVIVMIFEGLFVLYLDSSNMEALLQTSYKARDDWELKRPSPMPGPNDKCVPSRSRAERF